MVNRYDTVEFKDFISPDCNRLEWICRWLEANGINYAVIPTGKLRHIYIDFPKSCYDTKNGRKIKTVLVHYDRIGIGANDNSSAVYQVLNWAQSLFQSGKTHNIRIIFTDGEELGLGKSKDDLGVLSLANLFKKQGIVNDEIYAIDSCGRGNTLVISTSGKNTGSRKFQSEFNEFYEDTIERAKKALPQNWVTLPTPYGDNAGFIMLGMKAVAISVLPKDEATVFQRALQKDPKLKTGIMNHKIPKEDENSIPATWLMMHTEHDSLENLWSESWPLMEKFLASLANY